jgi:hypothetical protein
MTKPSATINLTKLAGDSKELVESMARELEGNGAEEHASESRWPTRFISAGEKGAPPRWRTRFVAAGPKSAPTRD